MNPFKDRVEITRDEAARLESLHRAFVKKLEALSESQRSAVINTTAANMFGDADPYTVGLAQQMKTVMDINDRIRAAEAEIKEIENTDLSGYRPADPDFKGRALARKADLEEQIKRAQAHAITAAQHDFRREREEAVLHFRELDAAAAKEQAILSLRDEIKAQTKHRENAAIARRLVNGERIANGLQPLPEED